MRRGAIDKVNKKRGAAETGVKRSWLWDTVNERTERTGGVSHGCEDIASNADLYVHGRSEGQGRKGERVAAIGILARCEFPVVVSQVRPVAFHEQPATASEPEEQAEATPAPYTSTLWYEVCKKEDDEG